MKELKIALTPAQYEMLLEYLFVGNLVIDGQEINEQRIQNYATMLTEILDKAEEFGKKHCFFRYLRFGSYNVITHSTSHQKN